MKRSAKPPNAKPFFPSGPPVLTPADATSCHQRSVVFEVPSLPRGHDDSLKSRLPGREGLSQCHPQTLAESSNLRHRASAIMRRAVTSVRGSRPPADGRVVRPTQQDDFHPILARPPLRSARWRGAITNTRRAFVVRRSSPSLSLEQNAPTEGACKVFAEGSRADMARIQPAQPLRRAAVVGELLRAVGDGSALHRGAANFASRPFVARRAMGRLYWRWCSLLLLHCLFHGLELLLGEVGDGAWECRAPQ